MSVQRCQQETTSTEFLEWQEYFAWEMTERRPEHFYLAQIACEVRRGTLVDGSTLRFDDFLLQFKKPEKQSPITEDMQAAKLKQSKSAWLGITGLSTKPK